MFHEIRILKAFALNWVTNQSRPKSTVTFVTLNGRQTAKEQQQLHKPFDVTANLWQPVVHLPKLSYEIEHIFLTEFLSCPLNLWISMIYVCPINPSFWGGFLTRVVSCQKNCNSTTFTCKKIMWKDMQQTTWRCHLFKQFIVRFFCRTYH